MERRYFTAVKSRSTIDVDYLEKGIRHIPVKFIEGLGEIYADVIEHPTPYAASEYLKERSKSYDDCDYDVFYKIGDMWFRCSFIVNEDGLSNVSGTFLGYVKD